MWAIEMKKNISALAVLFYILTVPITQAGPVAMTFQDLFDTLCHSQGCTKNKTTGLWESDISEDCEEYCGKHRLGCLSSGKPQFTDLISGDKKGGGCETSANREPLAKEAMPPPLPVSTQSAEECTITCPAQCSYTTSSGSSPRLDYDTIGKRFGSLYDCDGRKEEWRVIPETCAGKLGDGRCPMSDYGDSAQPLIDRYCTVDGIWKFIGEKSDQSYDERIGAVPAWFTELMNREPPHRRMNVRHCPFGDELRFVPGVGDSGSNAELEDLQSNSPYAKPRRGTTWEEGSWNNVIGSKTSENLTYLPIGRARTDNQTPSWIRIQLKNTDESKLEYAHVTRIEVKLKTIQTEFDCDINWVDQDGKPRSVDLGKMTPDKCKAWGDPFNASSTSFGDHIIRSMVVSESGSMKDLWRKNFPRGTIDYSLTNCYGPNHSFDSQDAQGRFIKFSTKGLREENVCRDKPDGCSSLVFNFTESNKFLGIEGETCDTIKTNPVKSKYVYIWFPHGYMHIWSIDIYYQPTLGQFCADGLPNKYGERSISYEDCSLSEIATRIGRPVASYTRSRFRYGVKRGDGKTRLYDIDYPSADKRSLFVTENGVPGVFKLKRDSDSGQSQLIFSEPPAKDSLIEWSTFQPGACLPMDLAQMSLCSGATTSKDCEGSCLWVD